MAVTSGFFDSISGDRRYSADQMSTYFEGLVSDGIYENIGNRFEVTASAGMTVNVGSGRALIKSHWIKNDGSVPLTLDAADVQFPRIDTIVLRFDKREVSRNIDILIRKGQAAARPYSVEPERSDDVYELLVAKITVPKGATEIVQANITDMRSSGYCGWVTGIIQQVDTSDLFLQWQSAYEDYYARSTAAFDAYLALKKSAFDAWFNSLTSTLNVDMTLTKFQNTVTVTGVTDEITIGIYEYNSETDVLFAYVGGVLLVENVEYIISGTGDTAKIELANELVGKNDVTFIVLKNVIGKSVLTSGTTIQLIVGTASGSAQGTTD
jgi:hypothetical protein